MSAQYDNTVLVFEALCRQFHLPIPRIRPALPTDPCDFTSGEEVRINVEAYGEPDFVYHARHVFGHYACDLHCSEPNGNQDWADPVADMIADLIDRVTGCPS